MQICAYFDTNTSDKHLYIYKSDGTKVAWLDSDANKEFKTTTAFNIEANTTYYVYSYGTSSIYFRSFNFTPADPVFTSMEVNTDDIYYEGTSSQVSTSFQRVSDTSKNLRLKLNLKDQNGDDFALDNAYKTTGYFTVSKKSGDDVFTLGSYSVESLTQAARVYVKIPVAASGTEERTITYTNGTTTFSCSQSFTVTDPAVAEGTANFTLNTSSPTLTDNGVTISGGSANNDGYSFNENGILTVTAPENKVITGISITYSEDKADRTGGTITANTGTYTRDGVTSTWTGSATPVTLTMSNKARITAMTVTFSDAPAKIDPTIAVAVSEHDGLTGDNYAQIKTGRTVTLSSIFNNGAIDANNFDVVYTINNIAGYANGASISGDQLTVGHAAGRFTVTATATSKSSAYNNCSTTVGIQVNNSAGDGTAQEEFNVSDFNYADNVDGTNSRDNKPDRTLKGFEFLLTGDDNAKYNNNHILLKSGGKLTIRLMQLSETQRGGRGNETITIGGKDEEIGARDFGGHSLWED